MKYLLLDPKEGAWWTGTVWANRGVRLYKRYSTAKATADRFRRAGRPVRVWLILDDGTHIAHDEWRLLGVGNGRFTRKSRVK